MKQFITALSALAVVGFTPLTAQATDLDDYEEEYVERGPVVEGPPVIRRSYEYYDGPAATYWEPRYYAPYYYAGWDYGADAWYGRPYWRHAHRGHRHSRHGGW